MAEQDFQRASDVTLRTQEQFLEMIAKLIKELIEDLKNLNLQKGDKAPEVQIYSGRNKIYPIAEGAEVKPEQVDAVIKALAQKEGSVRIFLEIDGKREKIFHSVNGEINTDTLGLASKLKDIEQQLGKSQEQTKAEQEQRSPEVEKPTEAQSNGKIPQDLGIPELKGVQFGEEIYRHDSTLGTSWGHALSMAADVNQGMGRPDFPEKIEAAKQSIIERIAEKGYTNQELVGVSPATVDTSLPLRIEPETYELADLAQVDQMDREQVRQRSPELASSLDLRDESQKRLDSLPESPERAKEREILQEDVVEYTKMAERTIERQGLSAESFASSPEPAPNLNLNTEPDKQLASTSEEATPERSPKERINHLMDQLGDEHQRDVENAAAIYSAAQVATNSLGEAVDLSKEGEQPIDVQAVLDAVDKAPVAQPYSQSGDIPSLDHALENEHEEKVEQLPGFDIPGLDNSLDAMPDPHQVNAEYGRDKFAESQDVEVKTEQPDELKYPEQTTNQVDPVNPAIQAAGAEFERKLAELEANLNLMRNQVEQFSQKIAPLINDPNLRQWAESGQQRHTQAMQPFKDKLNQIRQGLSDRVQQAVQKVDEFGKELTSRIAEVEAKAIDFAVSKLVNSRYGLETERGAKVYEGKTHTFKKVGDNTIISRNSDKAEVYRSGHYTKRATREDKGAIAELPEKVSSISKSLTPNRQQSVARSR